MVNSYLSAIVDLKLVTYKTAEHIEDAFRHTQGFGELNCICILIHKRDKKVFLKVAGRCIMKQMAKSDTTIYIAFAEAEGEQRLSGRIQDTG